MRPFVRQIRCRECRIEYIVNIHKTFQRRLMDMEKINKAIQMVIEAAEEVGIEAVVVQKSEEKVVFDYYVDDFSKLDDDYYAANEKDEVIKFTADKGAYIARGEAIYANEEFGWQPSTSNHSSEFFSILTGIDCPEDYEGEEHYEENYLIDAPEVTVFCHAGDLTGFFVVRMSGYRGEYWQMLHPDINQWEFWN